MNNRYDLTLLGKTFITFKLPTSGEVKSIEIFNIYKEIAEYYYYLITESNDEAFIREKSIEVFEMILVNDEDIDIIKSLKGISLQKIVIDLLYKYTFNNDKSIFNESISTYDNAIKYYTDIGFKYDIYDYFIFLNLGYHAYKDFIAMSFMEKVKIISMVQASIGYTVREFFDPKVREMKDQVNKFKATITEKYKNGEIDEVTYNALMEQDPEKLHQRIVNEKKLGIKKVYDWMNDPLLGLKGEIRKFKPFTNN